MATLNYTHGATIKVANSTSYYVGANNQFFGGNGYDWIAMLRYNAPAQLAAGEFMQLANFIGLFKADTAWDSADVTIGLISSGWTTSTTDFSTLYSYITGTATTAYISANNVDTQLTLAITPLLQAWAASPSSYSGIYFRCTNMELTRIGASGQSIVTTVGNITACGAPSYAALNASLAETDPTLSWSGAAAGVQNSISAYEIEYAESADNSSWGSWIALKTVSNGATSGSTTVTISGTRGYYRKYRIRTQGSAGATYYSGWTETGSCKRNSAPTAPTAFVAAPAIFISGDISLTYSGATDADNNISTYNIQYAVANDGVNYASWISLDNGIVIHNGVVIPAGAMIKYQIRTVDVFGVTSGWFESNTCGKNTAPAAPVITYPQASKTIYNSRPRFLLTMGADPESHSQSIAATGYTASTASGLAGSAKTILRLTAAASAGTVSLEAISSDLYAEPSSSAARDTTYAVPSFTDATITKGTTEIKAAHVTELRTMINTVRAYYGLAAVSWAETVTAGVTKARNWAAHIVEMQAAITDVVALVNTWDTASTANRIALTAWITPGAKPSAAVMQQIRAAIVLL